MLGSYLDRFFLILSIISTCYACNVTLYATENYDNFTSPNYPGNYGNNTSCYWEIIANTSGYNVVLDMLHLDTEQTFTCSADRLQIYDANSNLIKTVCGSTRWLMNVKTSSTRIVFTTDGTVTGSGFRIRYHETPSTLLCSNNLVASSTPREIFSPGYPTSYYNIINCVWDIRSDKISDLILLEVQSLDVQVDNVGSCYIDYVTITDYDHNFDLGRLCGNNTPSFLSSGSTLRITFTTDSSVVHKGFVMTYRAIPGSECQATTQANNESMSFITPNMKRYNNMQNCSYVIEAPNQANLSLRVDVTTSTGTSVFTPSTSSLDDITVTYVYRNGTEYELHDPQQTTFISDSKIIIDFFGNMSAGTSHKITYRVMSACGHTELSATTKTNYLSSPNYPYSYPSNAHCIWYITAQGTHGGVLIQTLNSNLGTDSICNDYVVVYNGFPHRGGSQLGMLCETQKPAYISSGTRMAIEFHSDGSSNHLGFRMTYQLSYSTPRCNNRQVHATVFPSILDSPGYPINYANNMDCTRTIRAINGRVRLTVLEYDTESCSSDYLLIYDAGFTYGQPMARVCPNTLRTFYSSGRYMTLRFITDSALVKKGYRLQYSSEPIPNSLVTTTVNPTCGTSLDVGSSDTVYIDSPNYPNAYGFDLDCGWVIKSTDYSKVIDLNILTSNVESSPGCTYDYVEAFDGFDDTYPSLGRWCGRHAPHKHSSGIFMFLKFHTDDTINKPGFSIEVSTADFDTYKSSVNVGAICAGIIGAVVLLALVACCVATNKKRAATANDVNRARGRRTNTGRVLSTYNEYPRQVYSISGGNIQMAQQPATFMPPPAYSEVVKDNPPPYSLVSTRGITADADADGSHNNSGAAANPGELRANTENSTIGHTLKEEERSNLVTSGAVNLQGIDNPAGPQ